MMAATLNERSGDLKVNGYGVPTPLLDRETLYLASYCGPLMLMGCLADYQKTGSPVFP